MKSRTELIIVLEYFFISLIHNSLYILTLNYLKTLTN